MGKAMGTSSHIVRLLWQIMPSTGLL